ncbi:hypothetical protein [Nitrosomonas sp.]|uniref:hypothetical protein n=1 Tax=Nitrosomonas sp. TaxID=42353 RepID=UPI0028404E51|nr:hypothetical protein [Nitrosomonas sp.]MDR4513223.1 hypothetical protein [Nitrosomonas sp.]
MAESKLAGRDPTVFIEEHKRVKLCCDIYQNINELINFAANRLTTPLNQLKEKHYAQILDQIHLNMLRMRAKLMICFTGN